MRKGQIFKDREIRTKKKGEAPSSVIRAKPSLYAMERADED